MSNRDDMITLSVGHVEDLERERDEARNQRDHYKHLWDDACEQVAAICSALGVDSTKQPADMWTLRDVALQLRAVRDALSSELTSSVGRVERAWQERDEARAQLEEVRGICDANGEIADAVTAERDALREAWKTLHTRHSDERCYRGMLCVCGLHDRATAARRLLDGK